MLTRIQRKSFILRRCLRWTVRGIVGGLLLVALGVAAQEETPLPLKGMRVPLELYDNGQVKMLFSAAQARIPKEGEAVATDATVEAFREDGARTMLIEAETCRLDRASGRVYSESAVRMQRADMGVSGTGMVWDASVQKLYLHANVRVVFKGVGLGKALPEQRRAKREGTP